MDLTGSRKGSTEKNEQQHDQKNDTAADIHVGLHWVVDAPGGRSTDPIGPSARGAVCAAPYVVGIGYRCGGHPGFALLNPGYRLRTKVRYWQIVPGGANTIRVIAFVCATPFSVYANVAWLSSSKLTVAVPAGDVCALLHGTV